VCAAWGASLAGPSPLVLRGWSSFVFFLAMTVP
jgi:hypothetical protein